MELFETQAPKTTTNFLNYVDNSSYIDNIIHRSIPDFIVQSGGFNAADGENGIVITL